jgi:hypothetical protein
MTDGMSREGFPAGAEGVTPGPDGTAGGTEYVLASLHDDLLAAILRGYEEDLNGDDRTAEAKAEHYVRWLESERERLVTLLDAGAAARQPAGAAPGPDAELRRRIGLVAQGLERRVNAGSRTRMAKGSESLARILRDILAETAAEHPEPQPAPGLAAPELRDAMAETRKVLSLLDEVTNAARTAKRLDAVKIVARDVRKRAGLPTLEGK